MLRDIIDSGAFPVIRLTDRSLKVNFDGREVEYDVTELDELVHTYATTIHKAQGTEYPIVVMPVLMNHYVMLQRNLIYTGITRAKKKRESRDLAQIADEMQFFGFMTIVAAHTLKPVVYEKLATAAGISASTAKKWLSILMPSHIVALVQPYHNNALKRWRREQCPGSFLRAWQESGD